MVAPLVAVILLVSVLIRPGVSSPLLGGDVGGTLSRAGWALNSKVPRKFCATPSNGISGLCQNLSAWKIWIWILGGIFHEFSRTVLRIFWFNSSRIFPILSTSNQFLILIG